MPGLAKPLHILIYLTHTLTTSSRNDYFIPLLQMKRLLHGECLPNATQGFNSSELLPRPCSLPLLSRVILSQGRRANNQTSCTKTLLRPCEPTPNPVREECCHSWFPHMVCYYHTDYVPCAARHSAGCSAPIIKKFPSLFLR